MAELFRKVYIRTEADLPKEMGIYDVSPNHDDGTYAFDPNNPYDIEHWVNEIDWYLAPVEEVTDEKIESFANKQTLGLKGDPYIRKRYEGIIEGIKWMRDRIKGGDK